MMKRGRIRSVEDLESLPEDEWVEVVGGMKFNWIDKTVHMEGKKLVVPLPAKAERAIRPRKGEELMARFRKGSPNVERRPLKRGSRRKA